MSEIRDLHHEAMGLADKALECVQRGNKAEAERFFSDAYELEYRAAQLVVSKLDAEPTRGMLFSSAASLSFQAGRLREAEQMLCFGLAGNPMSNIADDMRDLLERVNFGRHLALRGATLAADELRMAIAGNGVSYGIAPSNAFVQRLEFVAKLLTRTAERVRKVSFRVAGPPAKEIREAFNAYVQVPTPASFAITFRIGEPSDQLSFNDAGFSAGAGIVDEVMVCLRLFDESDEHKLRNRIGSDDYYNNFVAIAQHVAPDGRDISMVGFTANRNGQERHVNLERTNQFLAPIEASPGIVDKLISTEVFMGELRGASSRYPGREGITIISKEGKHPNILVPTGIGDIVKPLWEESVIVTARRVKRGRKTLLILETIRRADDDE